MNETTPEDARTLFQLCRLELTDSVAGHRRATDRLALLATRALLGESMLRALLIGSPGVGKTTLARRVAGLLDVPFLEFSAAHLSEEGWKGTGPSEHLSGLLDRALSLAGSHQHAVRLAERSVILVDEIDKTRLPGRSGSTVARENRTGKQLGLINLIGDGTITIERGSGPTVAWRSRKAVVIAAGVFDDLEVPRPSAGDLINWGLVPELAERLARGLILRLDPLSAPELIAALRMELEPVENLFHRFGHRLVISDAALGYVAQLIVSGTYDAGLRAAAGWIEESAQRMLVRLLTRHAESTRLVLGPDDVVVPAPPDANWRE